MKYPDRHWELLRAERGRLLALLEALDETQWNSGTLCEKWSVREVAAHLAAAGSTGTVAWLANMARSGFDTDRHNQRLLGKYLGESARQTLGNYQQSCRCSIAPLNSARGLLGEVLVHGQDIAVPLGAALEPGRAAIREVAGFFASRDFAVNSKSLAKGLALVGNDDSFSCGSGPVVRGKLLDLVMALAGRKQYLERLEGEGLAELSARLG